MREKKYRFVNIKRCCACAAVLSESERMNSHGRCPHCGFKKNSGTVVACTDHSARVEILPWWKALGCTVLWWCGIKCWPRPRILDDSGPHVVLIRSDSHTQVCLYGDPHAAEARFSAEAQALGLTHDEAVRALSYNGLVAEGDNSVELCGVVVYQGTKRVR